jgi:Abnormal spindle-like microcephaly-assoc'd, ASPM-SPD-2-Hydin
MHLSFCLWDARFAKIVYMRCFPRVLVVCLLCWLAPASARAQLLQCKPCRHGFDKVQIGDSKSYFIQLTNTGDGVLQITSASEQGAAFSFGNFPLPQTINPGASTQMPIIFTPTAQGHISGIFTLISNDPNSPLAVHVAGNGVYLTGPELGVSPAILKFGSVTMGSSANLQATLTASNAAVTISSDGSTSSEFAIVGLNLPVTISAGQVIPVTIQFTPNASGPATGNAGFTSDAVDSPTIEALTGTGVAQVSHSVYLSWDAGDGNAVGYNVYLGTSQGGPYEMINTVLDASTNYTDYTVVSGSTYYYVATEVNAQGQESGYSNVAQAVIPNP